MLNNEVPELLRSGTNAGQYVGCTMLPDSSPQEEFGIALAVLMKSSADPERRARAAATIAGNRAYLPAVGRHEVLVVDTTSWQEVGRIQVAARALGVGQAALDDALRYAQQRESFGKPIWKHQSVGNLLADMATKQQAARLLTRDAAEKLDAGRRADLEAGMAKLFASEAAMQIALDAIRVHGGYGYSREYDVERYFRDAPLMIVGEGTNEIQRNVIAAQLIARNAI